MKKVLISVAIASLMSTGVFASVITGTIDTITTSAYGNVKIVVKKADNTLSYSKTILGTDDAKKTMTALAMTAKASDKTVDVVTSEYDGQTGCTSITMK